MLTLYLCINQSIDAGLKLISNNLRTSTLVCDYSMTDNIFREESSKESEKSLIVNH